MGIEKKFSQCATSSVTLQCSLEEEKSKIMFANAVLYGLNHNGWRDDSTENDYLSVFGLLF